jgi:hypothetical protein
MPAAGGTVTFTRGNRLLGIVPLAGDGTASLTVSTLQVGKGQIQAFYNGTPDYFPSASPLLVQRVVKFPTTTTLFEVALIPQSGGLNLVVEAFVEAGGATGVTPVGHVVFRRNGRFLGRVRLRNGLATLILRRRVPRSGTFAAAFQGSTRFRASKATPFVLVD